MLVGRVLPMTSQPRCLIVGMMATLAVVATGYGVCAQPFENRNQQPHQDAASKAVNEVVDQTKFQNLGNGVLWRYRFGVSNTRYIRFRFDNIKSPLGAAYTIRVVREPAEDIVASYTAEQFAKDDMLVTKLLPPGNMRVELVASSPPTGLVFRLESAFWQIPPVLAKPESILPNFVFVRTLPDGDPGRKAAQAVATVYLLKMTCSGILIDRKTVATNYHCIKESYSYQATANTTSPACADVLTNADRAPPASPFMRNPSSTQLF
jgi:hypothetical protein